MPPPAIMPALLAEIQAYQFVFAARIEEAIGHSGMSADLGGKDLRASTRLESGWRGGSADEFTSFGENEQLIARERKRGSAEIVLLAAGFAGLEFDATKAGGRFEAGIGPAMDAVKKTVVIDARGVVIGKDIVAGPDFFRTILFYLQQNRAEAVAGGEEDLIVNDHRSCGSDRRANGRTIRILEEDFSVRRIKSDKIRERQNEDVPLVVDGRGDWRGIAGLIVGRFPENFAGKFVEGDDASAFATADVEDYRISFDQWRASDAEEAFGSVQVGFGIEAPNLFARSEIKAG